MDDKDKQNKANAYALISNSKRENLDDSHLSISDIRIPKNDITNESKIDNSNKLSIIEEETKNYVDDMKKGTYNFLVNILRNPR